MPDAVTWTSNNSGIVTVEPGASVPKTPLGENEYSLAYECTIQGIEPGTASVTATANGFQAVCLVTVTETGGSAKFPGHLLDFSYILFDIIRYSEKELCQAANVVSSVFYLEQTVDSLDLAGRLRGLTSVLTGMTPEQFRQVTIWLKNVSERKLPEPLRAEVDRVLDETKPQEVTKVISNIERALDKMQKQALMNGKTDTARAALREGLDVDMICKITGLSNKAVLELKRELEN